MLPTLTGFVLPACIPKMKQEFENQTESRNRMSATAASKLNRIENGKYKKWIATAVIALFIPTNAIGQDQNGESAQQDKLAQDRQNQSGRDFTNSEQYEIHKKDGYVIAVDRESKHAFVLKVTSIDVDLAKGSRRSTGRTRWELEMELDNLVEAEIWYAQKLSGIKETEKFNEWIVSTKGKREFLEWAQNVLLRSEFGNKEKVVKRWVDPPTISLFDATKAETKQVQSAVDKINLALQPTGFGKIQIGEPADDDADIIVRLIPKSKMRGVARSYGFELRGRNWGYFSLKWNENKEIKKAIVLLANDVQNQYFFDHLILEELTQSLGPMNDANDFKDSMFYSGFSQVRHLSRADTLLLQILYSRLEPGDRKTASIRAIKRVLSKLGK